MHPNLSLDAWFHEQISAFLKKRTLSPDAFANLASSFDKQLKDMSTALSKVLLQRDSRIETHFHEWWTCIPTDNLKKTLLVMFSEDLQRLHLRTKHSAFVRQALQGLPLSLYPINFLDDPLLLPDGKWRYSSFVFPQAVPSYCPVQEASPTWFSRQVVNGGDHGIGHDSSVAGAAVIAADAAIAAAIANIVAIATIPDVAIGPVIAEEDDSDESDDDDDNGEVEFDAEKIMGLELDDTGSEHESDDGLSNNIGPLFGVANRERDAPFVWGTMSSASVLVGFPMFRETHSVLVRSAVRDRTGVTDTFVHGYLLHLSERDREAILLSDQRLDWIVQVLSAPLAFKIKTWMLNVALQLVVMAPPKIDVQTHLHQRVVAFSLADTCSFDKARPFLLRALALPKPLPLYFGHVAEVYGVYVCDSSTLATLQLELKVPLFVLDVAQLHARGLVEMDQIYNAIVSKFTDNTLIVYVRGMPLIPDQLLKWCAEFTKSYCYAYLYFEELNTDRKFVHLFLY
jgi:hypothetical protein